MLGWKGVCTAWCREMGAMHLCQHHDRRVAKNRKMGFRGQVRLTKFAVDRRKSCFALILDIVSGFDKRSLLSLILNTGNILLCCAVLIWEAILILEAELQARVVDVFDSQSAESELAKWEVQLKASRRSSSAVTFHTIGSQRPPCGLAQKSKGFLGSRRMKIKLRRQHGHGKYSWCSDALVWSWS